MCGFRFRQFSGSGDHIIQHISTKSAKSHVETKFSNALYSIVNNTGNRNRILEMCKFRFRLLHWIDPRSIEHSYACDFKLLYPSFCVCICRSLTEFYRHCWFVCWLLTVHWPTQTDERFVWKKWRKIVHHYNDLTLTFSHMIMMNVMWPHFNQSTEHVLVGHTTTYRWCTTVSATLAYMCE